MPNFKLIDSIYDLDTSKHYVKFANKGKIVDSKGKEISPFIAKKGHYRLIAREVTFFYNIRCRKLKGTILVICTLGIALASEKVRDYFAKYKCTTYAIRYVNPASEVHKGYLYRIKNQANKTKGYLFGSMHYTDTPRVKLAPKTKKAFKKAKRLYVELDLIAEHQALRLKPPCNPFKSYGFWGVDMHLIRKAMKIKRKILSLENAGNTYNICNKHDTSVNISKEDGILLYKEGSDTLFDYVPEDKGIAKRNRMMIPPIKKALKKDKLPFIAVGAAHLNYNTGLIALLEKKGWKVNRVKQ